MDPSQAQITESDRKLPGLLSRIQVDLRSVEHLCMCLQMQCSSEAEAKYGGPKSLCSVITSQVSLLYAELT